MSKNDIYCEQCHVRPKEVFCNWCNSNICRYCSESEHKCPEAGNDINAIMHEAQQNQILSNAIASIPSSGSLAPFPEIVIPDQLVNEMKVYMQKEQDLIIQFYKDQHDKLTTNNSDLQKQNEDLSNKIKDLEVQYAAEIKTIAETYQAHATAYMNELKKQSEAAIADHASQNETLKAQVLKLQSELSENLKKIQLSPRSTNPALVPKVNQPKLETKKPQWH